MCWLSPSSLREILNWNTYINNNMCRLVLEADPTDAGSSPSLFFFFFFPVGGGCTFHTLAKLISQSVYALQRK